MEDKMIDRVIPAKQAPPLQSRIVTALDNPNASAAELSELVAETELAIVTADETASAMRMKAADVLATPTPREAQDTMAQANAAELTRDRLGGILPKLKERYTAALVTERHAKWLGYYEIANAKREALAEVLDATRSRIKAELGSLNGRIKECNSECGYVNDMACEIGEYHDLDLLPLFAALRTIDAETSTEPDWRAANSSAAAFAASMAPPTYDPARWSDPEQQAARRAEADKQQREMGAHYQQAGKDQEARQNEEERERFARR
jgi:hypothetical protein